MQAGAGAFAAERDMLLNLERYQASTFGGEATRSRTNADIPGELPQYDKYTLSNTV